jgi:cytochrome c peroxidase
LEPVLRRVEREGHFRGPMSDPSAVTEFRQRIALPGRGPRALAVTASHVFVAEHFSDTLAAVPLFLVNDPRPVTIRLGRPPVVSPERRGEMLFHDATYCFQQWQSCASCHPDGRTDGLNWDLLNDGIGNPKNTKSMLLAHRTPPAMISGVRPTAEAAVRAGMEHILFADDPLPDADAIDTYLKSLRPVPSPRLIDGGLSPAAKRGQRLFEDPRVGCATCHPAPLYTDLKRHRVRPPGSIEHRPFDTPTLIEVWRTAPYLHDGRFLTVKELLVSGRHGRSAGGVEQLDEEQIDDLVEFVLSL